MRILVTLLTLVALLAPSVPAHPATAPDEALPTDPALTTGRLPNGLRYIIRPHRNPEGRVSIWLHVGSGSFNETETTQGLAHYLEHMAFNGSANFAPGSVVPFFQSLGLAFGRDQNAFTSFDQTTYQLTLPGADRDLLAKGMLFMSDVALRLSLDPTAIDSERHVILEEKRARASARQRVQDELFAQLAPESTLGRRLPIGIEPTIKAVTATDFRDYYTRWYVPSNMTVLVVGDTDPATVADVIRQQFGSGPAVPLPPPRDVGVKPTAGPRAIVVTDPELTRAEVSIARLQPPLAPATTVTQRRREIVEAMGSWAFNRRMSALVAAGQAAFLNADASLDDWPRALRMVTVAASGRPDTWRAMLSDLGTELQRARLHGFTERELQDARAAFVADAEEAVRRETTRPAREVLRALNRAVTAETPPMSATQRLALLQRVLPGITAREVSDIFAAAFDPGRALFICELPVTDDVPSEADLLALGRTAVDVKPDKPADVARAAALLATLPGGGAVVDSRTHAASGITSMWLDNGVRVHHRFVDQRKHEATIAITLAGGVIEETAANRGITEAALRAWQRPATSTLSSTQIRDLLTGAKVRVRAGMTGDTVSLSVSGDPAELERGLQLAYLLLTDPLIETAALEQWKDAEAQRLHERKRQPMQALMDVQTAALYPPRGGPGLARAAHHRRAAGSVGGRRDRSRDRDPPGPPLPGRAALPGAHRRQDPGQSTHHRAPATRGARRADDRGLDAAGRRPGRILRRRPARPARHAAVEPGRAGPEHPHAQEHPAGEGPGLQHPGGLRARRDLPGLRRLRRRRPHRAWQGPRPVDGAGGDVRALRQGRAHGRGADGRQEADGEPARRDAEDARLLVERAGDARLPRPHRWRPAGRPGAVRAVHGARGPGHLRQL